MQDRILALSGIHNFRDYGGYRVRAGALRRGMLWRSGHHCGASAGDLEAVHALGIATVIDLRGDSERAAYPCLRHDQFSGDVLFHPGETAGGHGRAAHEEGDAIRTAEDARAMMRRLYRSLPFRPALVGSLRLYFEALATRDGASLLHCVAGKDRTGIAAALLHSLLGVARDDVLADYMLTATTGDQDARIAALTRVVKGDFGAGMDDAALRVVTGVSPEFLEAALDAIAERHGSIAAYAAAMLDVDADRIGAIEARLVA